MTLQAIKAEIDALTPGERRQLTAYLVSLGHRDSEDFRKRMADLIDDKDPDHWVPWDEAEE